MPLSKKRNTGRMRAARAAKKKSRTALLSKALARRLHRLGVSPSRYFAGNPVSLNDYHALELRYKAKEQRVEWQSSRIAALMMETARLSALLAMQPAMQDRELAQRVAEVEMDLAIHEAVHDGAVEGPGQETVPFKDLKRFVVLHEETDRERVLDSMPAERTYPVGGENGP